MLALAVSVPTHPAACAGEVRIASADQQDAESRTEDRPESHFYGYLLDACEKLFEGEFDQTTFEENMRFLFGTKVRRLSDFVYSLCFLASPSILASLRSGDAWSLIQHGSYLVFRPIYRYTAVGPGTCRLITEASSSRMLFSTFGLILASNLPCKLRNAQHQCRPFFIIVHLYLTSFSIYSCLLFIYVHHEALAL